MIFLILRESETVYFFFIITFEFKKKKLQLFVVCRNVREFNIKEQSIYHIPPVNCFSTYRISNFKTDIKVFLIGHKYSNTKLNMTKILFCFYLKIDTTHMFEVFACGQYTISVYEDVNLDFYSSFRKGFYNLGVSKYVS